MDKMAKKKSEDKKDVQLTFSESSTSKKKSQEKIEQKKEPKTSSRKLDSSPKDKLVDLGKSIVEDINKGHNPKIELSVRGLSNVVYDKESKTLGLGDKTAQRFFFNVGQSKKIFADSRDSCNMQIIA